MASNTEKQRKIGIFSAELHGRAKKGNPGGLLPIDPIARALDKVCAAFDHGVKTAMNRGAEGRVIWVDWAGAKEGAYLFRLKAGRKNYRPPLAHLDQLTERENPREMNEAEPDATHVVFRVDETVNRIDLAVEEYTESIKWKTLRTFLRHCQKEHEEDTLKTSILKIDPHSAGTFLQVLDSLERASQIEARIDREFMGTFLGFANRKDELREDLKLVASADSKASLQRLARDLYDARKGDSTEARNKLGSLVRSIRVRGKTPEGETLLFETDLCRYVAYRDFPLDTSSGEIVSREAFSILDGILLECLGQTDKSAG